MATDVILPALGMAQDTGKIVQWFKAEGEQVTEGEPLFEIETDKATVEIEAPVSGVLAHVTGSVGSDIPVGQVIATLLSAGEVALKQPSPANGQTPIAQGNTQARELPSAEASSGVNGAHATQKKRSPAPAVAASVLALRMAEEHHLDLSLVQATGKRVQKADVVAYLRNQGGAQADTPVIASPKARRLAREAGIALATIKGNGPEGAILAADVLAASQTARSSSVDTSIVADPLAAETGSSAMSTIWRIMAERTTQSWTGTPHFYLTREVNVSRLSAWRSHMLRQSTEKVTYTDLLIKVVASALQDHDRLNASWREGRIVQGSGIHIGLAVAVEDGLVVPVIHQANQLGLKAIARQRKELVAKAQAGKLRPEDLSSGTFTISNLGMYGVDAFNAIINQPQAAILAVGRIVERVVPLNGQPAIQPMMVLTLSCDHRVVDGARGARFLETVANLIEEPLGLLTAI